MYEKEKICWFTVTQSVDIDTGEIIANKKAKSKEYVIIKKNRHVTVNRKTGVITITNECRRKQLTIF